MAKLKEVNIVGIRGSRKTLSLQLDEKSMLLYSDNGGGKSTIADALEWLYSDGVSHLANEEIDRKGGVSALRNFFLPKDKPALVQLKVTSCSNLIEKTITYQRDKLVSKLTDESQDVKTYLGKSKDENFILRYKQLIEFILASKNDKMKKLSEIIGYGVLTTTREVLTKIRNELKNDIKKEDFEKKINIINGRMLDNFGQNIISDKQFIDCINSLISPLGKKISQVNEIDNVIKVAQKPQDKKSIMKISILDKVLVFCARGKSIFEQLNSTYNDYKKQYEKLVKDEDLLKSLMLLKFLKEGRRILQGELFQENECPLCLTEKDKVSLISDLKKRIESLEACQSEKDILDNFAKVLKGHVDKNIIDLNNTISDIEEQSVLSDQERNALIGIRDRIKVYNSEISKGITVGQVIKDVEDLSQDEKVFGEIEAKAKAEKIDIENSIKDTTSQIVVKISSAQRDFYDIRQLEKGRRAYEDQLATIEKIYSQFIDRQKNALNEFLKGFSVYIDEYYQYMNPDERVESIQFVPIEDNDGELKGITIQFKFYGKDVTPPHKYLSESHLNCMGIAFFLASVKAFNKNNEFLILDDIISSFDRNHRVRFAQLLEEKFSDYQLIVLTHEKEWFNFFANMVKGRWLIKTLSWDYESGVCLQEIPLEMKNKIIKKFKKNELDNLGNDIRKYLEEYLKNLSSRIEVRVHFRFNDKNEDRMAYELITALKGTVKNHARSKDLKDHAIFDRLLSSTFIGNKDSHVSSYQPSQGDLQAFWNDVQELEALFLCEENSCGFVTITYYDNVNKILRCKCGKKKVEWEK